MKKHNGMRPQDVVILLKKTTKDGKNLLNKDIATSLKISPSEVSEALERCRIAKLVDRNKQKVNIMALEEFLIWFEICVPCPTGQYCAWNTYCIFCYSHKRTN